MTRPLVTAVITNYNYGAYVGEAIASALGQTYPHVEVIVVDDGSTDESRDVIDSFGDRITPLFQANGGQAQAFETGIAAAAGEFVCLLDADDVWLPRKVERVIEAGWESGAALVYNRIQRVDAELRPWGRPYPRATRFPDLADRARRSGGWWVAPPTSALSFRTAYLTAVRPIPDVYRICADAYVAGLAPYLGHVLGVKEALTLVRRHGANSWRGDVDREAELRRRAAIYELTVEQLNASLARLGRDERVRLEDHWPHHAVMSELSGSLHWREALVGLRFPAEKNPLRKAREVARVAYQASRTRRSNAR